MSNEDRHCLLAQRFRSLSSLAFLLAIIFLPSHLLYAQSSPTPFWFAGSWEELAGLPTSDENEDAEEYDPTRNPYWSQHDPVAHRRALDYVSRMPTQEEMEGLKDDRSLLGGRSWVGIGPHRGASVTRHANRFWQGRIRCIRWWRNPSSGDWTPVIGASSGGLYYRYRRSASPLYHWHWRRIGQNLPNPSVGAVLVSPRDFQTMWVGTGDWARYGGSGLYKTTDRGESWRYIPLIAENGRDTIIPSAITGLEYRINRDGSTDTNTLYLSSISGFFRSTNGGNSWQRRAIVTSNVASPIFSMVVHPRNGDTLWAGLSWGPGGEWNWQGVHKSTNGGLSWSPVNSGLPGGGGRSLALAISPSNPRILCAALTSDLSSTRSFTDTSGGIYRTTDGGGSWSRIGPDREDFWYMRGGQGVHTNAIAIHPTNPSIIYAVSVRALKSTNAGGSWTMFDGGHDDNQFVSFVPTNSDSLYIGSDGGVFVRDERAGTVTNNEPDFQGNAPIQSYGLDVAEGNSGFAIGGTQDNGNFRLRSIANTTDGIRGSWQEFMLCDGSDDIAIDPTNAQRAFMNQWCGGDGIRIRTLNGGDRADNVDGGLKGIWMTPIRLTKGSPVIVPITVDTANVWFSRDDGNSWREVVGGIRDFGPNEPVRRMAVSTSDGSDFSVYLTFWDDGATPARNESRRIKWIHLSNSLLSGGGSAYTISYRMLPDSQPAREVIADRWESGRAWALADPINSIRARIFETINSGEGWRDITGNLPTGINYHDVQRRPDNPNILYVSSDIGVFKTRNGGSTWYPLQQGLPVVGVNRMYYIQSVTGNRRLDTLRISTFGYGYWDRLLDVDDPLWISIYSRIEDLFLNDSLLRRLIATSVISGRSPGGRFSDTMIAVADSGRVLTTMNGGRSWSLRDLGFIDNISNVAARDCTSFAATGDNGSIYLLDSLNGTWRKALTPVKTTLRKVIFLDQKNGWGIGDEGTILSTNDGGESWWLSRGGGQWEKETLTDISFSDALNGFVSGYDGTYKPPVPIVLRTTDGGKNWWYDQHPMETTPSEKIAFIDGVTGYGLNRGTLLKSSDGGITWDILGTPSKFALRDFLFFTPDIGWVAGDSGVVFRTGDGGKNWEQEDVEHEGNIVALAAGFNTMVAVGDSLLMVRGPLLLAAGGGRIPHDTTGSSDTTSTPSGIHEGVLAAGIELGEPRPSPFSQSTSFTLALARPMNISLQVVDALGRTVRHITTAEVDAGRFEVVWDGRADDARLVPNGIYFIRLATTGGILVRHVVLMR